ncbi:MAG TPA: histidine phosphatase family protein [Bacteroidales bacterium]
MKKLIFVRHGKAEDGSSEITDFERSLTLKGKVISRLMAHKLREKEKSPGVIITSPAFRALETALIFAGEFGINPDKIILNNNIYYKMSLQNLPAVLSVINEDSETVTLFGHNPSFSQIANSLSKDGCDSMPKSGIICISFNIMTWSDIGRNNGKTEYFLKPDDVL